MTTFMCLRGTYTPLSTIHPKSKAAISKSEIESAHFGILCVISDYLTSGFHSCLHKMGSSSSVTTIKTTTQPSPDVSTDEMYAGSLVISSVT